MTKAKGRHAMGAAMLLAAAALLPVSAHAGAKGEEYFKQSDTNKDGALSKEEMAASRMQRLSGSDTNKDGFISADELAAHRAAMESTRKDKHFAGFAGRFDANKDGKVALEEIEGFESPFFKKADANGDGKLTMEEMKAAKAKAHEGMGGGKQGMYQPDGPGDD